MKQKDLGTILVWIENKDEDTTLMDMAKMVSGDRHSYIEAIYVQPDPVYSLPVSEEIMSPAVVEDLLDSIKHMQEENNAEVRNRLTNYVISKNSKMSEDTKTDSSLGIIWSLKSVSGDFVKFIRDYGRLVDYLVFRQPEGVESFNQVSPLQTAIYETSHPIVILPQNYTPKPNITSVLFAWDGSQEASEALIATRDTMRNADIVYVLTIDQEQEVAKKSAEICSELMRRRGINSESIGLKKADMPIGDQILDIAEKSSVDIIVMGAWKTNRFLELIRGGTTNKILTSSSIPLMISR